MTTPAPYSGGAYPPPPQSTQENAMGIAALVLGIVGVCCVAPIVSSILAIIFGKIGMNKADQGLANNKSMAQWGFWLGIAGLVLTVVLVAIYVVVLIVAVADSNYR